MGRRTNRLKELAETNEDEYEEYVQQCVEDGSEPVDIYQWVAEEEATAQEYENDRIRDDAIMDNSNV